MKTRSGFFQHMILFIGSALTVLLLSFAVFMFVLLVDNAEQKTELLRKASGLEIDRSVFYENVDSWLMTNKEKADEDRRIAALATVDHVDRISHFAAFEKSKEISLTLLQDTDNKLLLKNALIPGTYFDKNAWNQVFLPDAYKGVFREGEMITVSLSVPSEATSADYSYANISLELIVTGFFQEQPVISVSSGGNGVALQELLKYDPVCIVSALRDNSGNVLSGTAADYCMIYPKSGVEIVSLLEEIEETVDSPANVVGGQQIIDRYIEANAGEFRELVGLFLLCLLLGITLVWGRMIIFESSEERTLVIHYLCGSTWRREVFLLFLPILVELIVSIFLGILFYLYLAKQGSVFYSISLNADPRHFIFASSLMLLFYLFALLPIYFEAARKSPISLYRRD